MESRLKHSLLTFAAVASAAFASDNGDVRKALDSIAQHENAQITLQTRISEIPAPGFHEEQRAAFIASEFRRVGLDDVEIDGAGNVLGWRHGTLSRALVIAAHLDTVFPAGTDVKVK